MSKIELGYLIRTALNHALQQQEKLLQHKEVAQLLPVIQKLAKFNLELQQWYSGKYHLDNRCGYFLKKAKTIEAEADRISKRIWKYAPVSLKPVFERIKDRRVAVKKEQYPKRLRAQFNNFRLALLEQFAGARLLVNNSDLGDELERILLQYFERRLGTSVRVVRGGHIYDYSNNRSGQIDIIITAANALGICPADTGDGKHNVMIDQVIAAISVTSNLNANGLRKRIREFSKIPQFAEKAVNYPWLKDQAWPLCYVVGADCDDLLSLRQVWAEIGSLDKSPLQGVILLDSGYIRARTFYGLVPGSDVATKFEDLRFGTDDYAGLGLAWLESEVAHRYCIWSNQTSDWVQRLYKQLSDLEVTDLSPTYDPKRMRMLIATSPIHGILTWGWVGNWIHNRLYLNSICIGTAPRMHDVTLTDPAKPIARIRPWDHYDFEPRWFNLDVKAINGDYCALEEWVDPNDRAKHRRRIVVFDSRTGKEITCKLPRQLSECSEIESFNSTDFPSP